MKGKKVTPDSGRKLLEQDTSEDRNVIKMPTNPYHLQQVGETEPRLTGTSPKTQWKLLELADLMNFTQGTEALQTSQVIQKFPHPKS